MIIDDRGCQCEDCVKSGYCKIQKDIGYLQMVAFAMNPTDVVLNITTKECPYIKAKGESE